MHSILPWSSLFIPKPHGLERWQLIDLATNPSETVDLAEKEPERLEAMICDSQDYALQNQVVIQDAGMRDVWTSKSTLRRGS